MIKRAIFTRSADRQRQETKVLSSGMEAFSPSLVKSLNPVVENVDIQWRTVVETFLVVEM